MFGFLKKKIKETIKPEKSLKQRIISKITEKELTKEKIEELIEPLELNLLQSNVAMNTVNKIKETIINELTGKKVKKNKTSKEVLNALRKAINEVLIEGDVNEFLKKIKTADKPVTIMFIGTNGSGKTTTIAKIANYLIKHEVSVVLAACDTFRAAAIQQLEVHGKALGVKVIKHGYGADATAVAYDALEHAKAKGIKTVLIDTAGRSHSNTNLMKELEKMNRVIKPDITIFVGDSLTGNEVINQCNDFSKATSFDYVILTKTDVDEKGGAILSVSHETGVPILFLGTGQEYKDLKPFNKQDLIKNLLN